MSINKISFPFNYSSKLGIIVNIFIAVFLGKIIVDSPFLAGAAICALYVFLLVSRSPLKALSILIIAIPFSGTDFFVNSIINMPGAKPLQILTVFVLFIAILNYEQSVRMPRYAFAFMVLFLTVFSISIFRSLEYLDIFNQIWVDDLTPTRYLLSKYIKPLIYFVPFMLILKYAGTIKQFESVINTLCWSIVGLSLFILYLYLFQIADKGDMLEVSNHYQAVIGIHRNGLANFFIVGFPIFLARYFLKRDLISISSMGVTLCAVGFLLSRTAYVTVLLSFILYLIISKRAKFLPVLLTIFFALSFFISSHIIERASRGLESGDRDEISAGRIDNIWLPLIEEYLENPVKLIIGNGRYSTYSSAAVQKGIARETGHAHNMYLEQVLDSGILGLLFFLIFFMSFFLKIFRNLRQTSDVRLREYQFAIIISLISYFIAGMTGRSFFPQENNSYFWIVVALGIGMMHLVQNHGEYANRET